MIQQIHIDGIRLYAFHGCNDDEAVTGGTYLIDVCIDADFTKAAHSDVLSDTVDYCTVFEICKKEMAIRAKLIEVVVRRIHSALKSAFPEATHIRVKLTKVDPPIPGDVASVSVVMAG